jgi:hypothetical protein
LSKPELPVDHQWVVRHSDDQDKIWVSIFYNAGTKQLYGPACAASEISLRGTETEEQFDALMAEAMRGTLADFERRNNVREWVKKWQ